jgi:hypothetical protein
MQAIETKYYGPTNTKGAKIIAECAAIRVTIAYPYGLDFADAHKFAAITLCEKMGAKYGWNPINLTTGQLKNGNYAHVFHNA